MKVVVREAVQDPDTGDVSVRNKEVDIGCPRCNSKALSRDNLGMILCDICKCTFRINDWGLLEIMTEGLSCHLCKRPINSKSFYVCQTCSDYTCNDCVEKIKRGLSKGCR
jgi:hypothetical protein